MPLGVDAIINDLNAQLQILDKGYEHLPESQQKRARESQVTARRLVRSLCATIVSLQQPSTSTPSPSSNIQLLVSPSEPPYKNIRAIPSYEGEQVLHGSGSGCKNTYSQSFTAHSSSSPPYGVVLQENVSAEAAYADGCESAAGRLALVAPRISSRFSLLEKENVSVIRRQSRLIDSQQFDILAPTDGSSRSSLLPQSTAASRGAIPRSVAAQHETLSVSVVVNDGLASGFDVKYSVLVALALSASLIVLNVCHPHSLQWSMVFEIMLTHNRFFK
jgi:hypothetical protein